jgi:L-threonylcarbamoyladenylate synthase
MAPGSAEPRPAGGGTSKVVVLAPSAIDGLGDLAPGVIELEPAGPPDEYAHVLYDRLRQVDRLGADVLLAVPPPAGGLGDAVRDRLSRAAGPRPGSA